MTDETTSPDSQTTTDDTTTAEPDAQADAGTIVGGASDETTADAGETSTEVKGGDQTAEAKDEAKAEDKPSIIGAPEAYEFTDLKLGEGVTFDKAAFDAVEPVLREMDLSQDAASKLVGAYAEKIVPMIEQRVQTQAAEAGAALRADWARETQADKEIGGAHLEETKAMAARAMSKYLPQSEEGQRYRTFLNESGLGNHPEQIRFMSRVGRDLGEASVDQSGGSRELSLSEKFYGKKG